MNLGYAIICEEHDGRSAVANGRRAAEAGFDYLSVSDHFHPWLDSEGQSPFAWSVLGGLAATTDVDLMTAVTCPTTRYHPVIVAQAAATVGQMSGGRFTLGLGTGEALNEHVVGQAWPSPRRRLDHLAEAIEVIRKAFDGDEFDHDGPMFTVDRARLYTLPAEAPPIVVAAGGSEAAALAGRTGAGLIATSPDEDLVAAYRDAGGDGPLFGQATCCWAPSEDEAAQIFHEVWRHAALDWTAKTDIPTPEGFAQATSLAEPDTFRGGVPLGPDPAGLLDELDEFREAGFDAVAVHGVGPHQDGFIEWAANRLLD